MKKNGLNVEKIISCAILALMMSSSFILGALAFVGVTVQQCDATLLLAAFSCLSGGTWGALLCRHC